MIFFRQIVGDLQGKRRLRHKNISYDSCRQEAHVMQIQFFSSSIIPFVGTGFSGCGRGLLRR